jgi:branched-chain amino acid transport system ATP-binding protein
MLDVSGLGAAYGQAQALWDVSLRVEDGEIVTIVGPNGAGKSTLVNVLAGIHSAISGAIVLDGESLAGIRSHEMCAAGIAVVPEGRRVFPNMSVLDNLDLGAFHPEARAHRDETYAQVTGIFPRLADRSAQLAGSLSGGEQQMLAVGRALMSRPRLLLLDEPSLGLAPVIVEQIFDVIRQINGAGTSVLLVEQNVIDALELADRAYVLEEGRIVREGLPAELLEDEGLRATYFGL